MDYKKTQIIDDFLQGLRFFFALLQLKTLLVYCCLVRPQSDLLGAEQLYGMIKGASSALSPFPSRFIMAGLGDRTGGRSKR